MGKIRWVGAALVLVALAGGCQWSSGRFDAANTGNNTVERTLGLGNVDRLTQQWSAPLANGFSSEPVMSGNTVVVAISTHSNLPDDTLSAFPANGHGDCGGSPRTCAPLWTATGTSFGQPVIADGVVYLDGDGTLQAYDASGVADCSDTPKVCHPLWTGTTGGKEATVLDGSLYVIGGPSEIDVYHLDQAACMAGSRVCGPYRSFSAASACPPSSAFFDASCTLTRIALFGDRLYAGITESYVERTLTGSFGGITGFVSAFDLTGSNLPVWTTYPPEGLQPTWGLVAGEDGVLALGATNSFLPSQDTLLALAADGSVRWSDAVSDARFGLAIDSSQIFLVDGARVIVAPRVAACGPECGVRTYDDPVHGTFSPPALANGVLYVGGSTTIGMYDASGGFGCEGTPPVCAPVASIDIGSSVQQLSVGNGRVFATTEDNRLIVLGLART